MTELLEKLAELEHDQWVDWSKAIAKDLEFLTDVIELSVDFSKDCDLRLSEQNKKRIIKQEERLERWEKLWVPYDELSEEMKESDREYARKVLEVIKDE